MDLLWAPWRSQYIDTFNDKKEQKKEECFFCAAIEDRGAEAERLVVYRGETAIIMLNRYPYNGGHLLIAPYRHVGDLCELTTSESSEIMALAQLSIKALKTMSSPHAFNIGMNLGREAGAGAPDHMHMHVIPRWNGDTGFVTAISDIKIISQALSDTQRELSKIFREISK
jgi:ATP adenylyltransferase